MAKLKDLKLKGRSTYAKWWPQVEWKARENRVWDLVDPEGPDALAYNTSPPRPPPTISELKAKLDEERTAIHKIAVNEWTSRNPKGGPQDLNTKPKTPALVTFEDVKAEHTALLQDYTIVSNVHKTRSEQQSRFLI
jgi:hypothetical protein